RADGPAGCALQPRRPHLEADRGHAGREREGDGLTGPGAGAAGYARRTGHARRAERFPHLEAEAGPTVRLAAEGEVGQELEGDVAHDVAAGPGHRCAQPPLARPTGESPGCAGGVRTWATAPEGESALVRTNSSAAVAARLEAAPLIAARLIAARLLAIPLTAAALRSGRGGGRGGSVPGHVRRRPWRA